MPYGERRPIEGIKNRLVNAFQAIDAQYSDLTEPRTCEIVAGDTLSTLEYLL
jgi:hypothetical protein